MLRNAQAITVYQECETPGRTDFYVNVSDVRVPDRYGPEELATLEKMRAEQFLRIHKNCTQVSVAVMLMEEE
jgi:hypothetical protein